VAVPAHPSLFVSLGVGALLAWRVYGRIKRAVGRQKFSKGRAWTTVCFFPVIAVLLCYSTLKLPNATLALVGGLVVGTGLGIYGLRLTKFESTPEGLFYTPNAHLGIALSLLLILRIGYRFFTSYFGDAAVAAAPTAGFVQSPLTLAMFGTVAGYYVMYAIGLLHRHRVSQVSTSPETS